MQCSDDIKDGDVLLVPDVCAAVHWKAWPIIAAGPDWWNGGVLHTIVAGKTFRDLKAAVEAYEAAQKRDM